MLGNSRFFRVLKMISHSFVAKKNLVFTRTNILFSIHNTFSSCISDWMHFIHTNIWLLKLQAYSFPELPKEPVDLVIHALLAPEEESTNEMSSHLTSANQWANENKAPVLLLDPCSRSRMLGSYCLLVKGRPLLGSCSSAISYTVKVSSWIWTRKLTRAGFELATSGLQSTALPIELSIEL